MEQMKNDAVNHPAHYTDGKYEVIAFINKSGLHVSFQLANAIKYICRSGKKNPDTEIEDLKKALWYIRDYDESGTVIYKLPVQEDSIDVVDFIEDKGLLGLKGNAILAITRLDISMAKLILLELIRNLESEAAK